MQATEIRQEVDRELQTLPDERLSEVLDYIRFLKIRFRPDEEVEACFVTALERARIIAQQQGITEEVIEQEIEAVRADR
jgi:uncharacterized protein YqkB